MYSKICNTCGLEFLATRENFNIDNSCKFGLSNRCKLCSRKKAVQYHAQNKDKSKAYREANREHILENKRNHYKQNKARYNETSKKNYIENKSKYIAMSREWKKNNPEKVREYSARHYQKVKERHKILTRNWKQEHKDLRNIHWQNRRSMKSKVISNFSEGQWEKAKAYFNNKCAYCGEKKKLTQDHYIPIFLGGNHIESNIIPCCSSCNSSKSIKLFDEWYPLYKHYNFDRYNNIKNYIDKATQ